MFQLHNIAGLVDLVTLLFPEKKKKNPEFHLAIYIYLFRINLE